MIMVALRSAGVLDTGETADKPRLLPWYAMQDGYEKDLIKRMPGQRSPSARSTF
jgi:hypothetical protein